MRTPIRLERRSIAVAALALLLGAGCHADGGTATGSGSGPYTRADVDAIVLGPNDAPIGTSYVDAVSGYKDLPVFARDDTELGHLREDGFRVGHVVLFLPTDHVHATGPTAPLTNDSVIVQGITGLFDDADGADRTLERYVEDLRTRQVPDATEVDVDGLGDRSLALRGETPDGSRVLIFVWRVGNVILIVSGSGLLAAAEVRALADLVNARAS
jgi:hypothetical protein